MNTLSPGTKGQLTLLDANGGSFAVEVEEVCGVQMYLRVESQLPFAAAVKFETPEALLLGDVTHCEAQPAGFLAGVTVRHKLNLLPMLTRLDHALAGTGAATRPPQPEGGMLLELQRLNAALTDAEIGGGQVHVTEEEHAPAGKM